MRSVNIRQARRRLSEVVDAAERGESVVITRRGRRAARVTPADPGKGRKLPDLTEFRKSVKAKGRPLSKVVIRSRKEARF